MKLIVLIFGMLICAHSFGADKQIIVGNHSALKILNDNLDLNNPDSVSAYLKSVCANDELNPYLVGQLECEMIDIPTIFNESLLEDASKGNAVKNVKTLLKIDFSQFVYEDNQPIDTRPFYYNGLAAALLAPPCEGNLQIIRMIATKCPAVKTIFPINPLSIIAETSPVQDSPKSLATKPEQYRIKVVRILLDTGILENDDADLIVGSGLTLLREFVQNYQPKTDGATSSTTS